MRPKQIVITGAGLFLIICAYSLLRSVPRRLVPLGPTRPPIQDGGQDPLHDPTLRNPKPAPGGSHPIWHLMTESERELEGLKTRQSRTLQEAVAEYRRRYGIPPPPNFDKWWAFARKHNVQLVDEFDTIHEVITPFWGLRPETIRARAVEAVGYYDNALMAVQIRGGNVTHINYGTEWMQKAVRGMLEPFIEHLPDMDLAFNMHDEPRVIVPHEDMVRLVDTAKRVNMPAANAVLAPRNTFSQNKAMTNGLRAHETKQTRFNQFAHQATWTHSRMSCPPESPSRALEEADRVDEQALYAVSELGFVYNITAMSDICLSPSLAESHGFFDRPNAFNIVHDLMPVFSQSKMSSYADVLYPSPWYWYDKVPYDEAKDQDWDTKLDRLYWRGSTTGGFSRYGGWRRQHRQRFVQKINAADSAKVLANRGDETQPRWEVQEVPRGDFKDIMDVFFSHVGQCDPGDCDAQREFFTIKEHAEQQDAWKYKYLLDIDGNAFSGRFYAFLRSKSLVYKWAVFREWHYEWLKPWVHYIPLSQRGDDWLEAVRFFGDGTLGKREAERMARQGQDWANKVLRKEDMEAWFFRLLLEYGRVVDDDRKNIGFAT